MESEDVLAGLGSIFSTILAGVFYILDNPVFSTFTGAMITYFVQSKLQDRTDKRKIMREKTSSLFQQ